VIHEFGHGLSCKAFGGEVHEMGFLFLCFSPAMYCNVSDAWRLPNKWHRIIISAAGIYVELMIAALRAEHRRALAEGFAGLSVTGDVVSALGAAEAEALVEYERRLDEEFGDATQVLLCQYDQHRFETGTLVEMTEAHHVEVSPPLATLDPTGALAAARVHPPETLRLAGDLDFENVAGLLDYLDANVHGPLRVDLADVAFADVAGMRALRGSRHQQLMIADASEAVRRLVGLLGWDTDPGVLVAA